MSNLFYQANDQKRLRSQFVQSIKSMPYLSVAFGLYWMMTVLFLYSPYLFEMTSPSAFLRPPAGMVTAVVSVITYFICASRFRSFSKLDGSKYFFLLLAVLLVAGICLYMFSLGGLVSDDFGAFLYICGLGLLGIGTAFVCLEVSRIFAFIGAQRVLFYGTLALFGGSICAFLVSLFPAEVGGFVLAVIPVALVACLAKSMDALPRKRLFDQGLQAQVHVPRRFLITSAIQGMSLGVMHSILPAEFSSMYALSVVGYCVAAVLLMVTAIVVMQDFNTLFYRVGFPMMALGFFIVSAFDDSLLFGGVFLDIGYAYQYLIACCLCAYLAQSLSQSPIWIVGISTGCLLTGQFLGEALSAVTTQDAAALFMAFFVLASALYLYSADNMRSGWGSIRPGTYEEPSDPVAEMCYVLADERGLSKREKDVLVPLVKGHTRKEISAQLHLSDETVKTHTSNIYQKFYVHSKRELAKVIEDRLNL